MSPVLTGLLTVAALMCGACSSGSQEAERDQALDRFHARAADREAATHETEDETATHETEDEAEAEAEQAELLGAAVPEVSDQMLIEPRYFGSLPDGDPLVLGVFEMRTHRDPIIDGDTVAVYGLDASLRMVGIDAEEVWHGQHALHDRAYSDFDDYVRLIYAESDGIPKFATPMGDAAREYARQFFEGDTQVRLELDDTQRIRGYFDRYLVYVFAFRDGQWVNYNVESVRAGMSPYFPKYGYSARFHDEFIEAQAAARAQGRGIWNPELRHYPDYDERLVWWTRRAEAIRYYRQRYGSREDYAEVGIDAEFERLSSMSGQTVTVFGTIGDIRLDYTPQRATLSHKIGNDFILVAFDSGVLESYNFDQYRGEYVYIRGRLNLYRGRPQFILDEGVEIWIEP